MSEVLPNDSKTVPVPADPRTTATPPPTAAPPPRRRKKKRRGWIVLVVLLLLVAIIVGAIIGNKQEDRTMVEVQTVSRTTIVETVPATGTIAPETQVKISPEVSGEIIYLAVKEGDVVTKGQVLVRINPQSMMAQRAEASAAISAARARQSQAEANMLRAQQEFARVKQLFDKKLATAQELEGSETQVKVTRSERDAARFQVEQAQASLRQVQESLNKTTIVAPISGTVTKLNSKLGEKVVGAIQMTGTEIMTIADLSVIEAVVDVSETDVVKVSLGDVAEVEVDAMPNQKFKAVVSQIANSPKQSNMGGQDQLTNFEVHLRFVTPDNRFRPGMTATATIETERKDQAVAVPIQSVTTRLPKKKWQDSTADADDEGRVRNTELEKSMTAEKAKQLVFLKVGDIVVPREVTTGIRDDQNIEILTGVKVGDVVVSGSYKAISQDLDSGMVVGIKKEESVSASGGKK